MSCLVKKKIDAGPFLETIEPLRYGFFRALSKRGENGTCNLFGKNFGALEREVNIKWNLNLFQSVYGERL